MTKYDITLVFLDVEGEDESDAYDKLVHAMRLDPAYEHVWVDIAEVPEEEA